MVDSGFERFSRPGITRREFVRWAAAGAAIAVGGGVTGEDWTRPPPPRPNAPLTMPRVVRATSEKVLPARVVQRPVLRDCLSKGLCALTDESDVRDAWYRLFQPDDRILIKFNRSLADRIGTTPPLAEELVSSLTAAGFAPEQLMLLEAESGSDLLRKTRPPDVRWQGREVSFGRSGADVFMAVLDEATAIINVPFLKTHHLATMTCCLKNLSHGLIRRPSRFHGGGCDPAIGEIVASEPIRSKKILNIVNCLRVVFDRGSEATESEIEGCGTLLLARDGVAADAVGYSLLNEIRSKRELAPLLPDARIPRFLATAGRLGIGQWDEAEIDQVKLEL